jgi:hypothetical protein
VVSFPSRLDETWQTTGQMDEIGRLLGLCADCQPRDEGEEGDAG